LNAQKAIEGYEGKALKSIRAEIRGW
jgi:hypothetical protein